MNNNDKRLFMCSYFSFCAHTFTVLEFLVGQSVFSSKCIILVRFHLYVFLIFDFTLNKISCPLSAVCSFVSGTGFS